MCKRCFICILLIFSLLEFRAQSFTQIKKGFADSNYNLDSLKMLGGKNKRIPMEFTRQCLIALTHYPDLVDKKIIFKYSRIRTTMSSRPRILTIFSRNRGYKILINKRRNFGGVHLEEAPFNAQVGIIGHELGHIVDFERMGGFKLIGSGIHYFSVKGKKKIENAADSIAIFRGLGWQLYDWSKYSVREDKTSPIYRRYKKKIYMGPEDIEKRINSMGN